MVVAFVQLVHSQLLCGGCFCPVSAQSAAAAVNDNDDDDDAQQQVLEHLVDEFLELVVDIDRQSAQQYIISNQMNLEAAVGTYFDDYAS